MPNGIDIMLQEKENELCKKRRIDDSQVERVVIFCKHLFGFHDSSCRVAGRWRLEDHKRLRGPLCTRTKLPLLLPRNRKGRI